MNVFTLPVQTQIHLCLNQREARALSDLIELHLLREDANAAHGDPDFLAEKELTQSLRRRLADLAEIETGIIKEMRNLGWSVS